MEILNRLLEPQNLQLIAELVIAFLYITGRITRGQFMAEQMKAKGIIESDQAKSVAVDSATKPITFVFDLLNMVPVLNSKVPVINMSIPDMGKSLIQGPIGLISDILHNIPLLGTNINK